MEMRYHHWQEFTTRLTYQRVREVHSLNTWVEIVDEMSHNAANNVHCFELAFFSKVFVSIWVLQIRLQKSKINAWWCYVLKEWALPRQLHIWHWFFSFGVGINYTFTAVLMNMNINCSYPTLGIVPSSKIFLCYRKDLMYSCSTWHGPLWPSVSMNL